MRINELRFDGEVVISEGGSRTEKDWKRRSIQWSALLQRFQATKRTDETVTEYEAMTKDQRLKAKDTGGFVGGGLHAGERKKGSVAFRQILTLDADYGKPDLWDDVGLLLGYAACMHTTHTHTPENPRLRLLWPLARPVSPSEYEALGRKVASWLGIEQFDDTTYEPNRLMFYPSTPKDGEYLFNYIDGPWLNPDKVLAEYTDWRDMSQWPVSSRATAARQKRAEKQGDPREKPGIVGAFCRVYDVPGAISAFLGDVYAPCGENRYTYTGGTTSGGLVLYDGGDFAYSHHDSDPCGGLLCNAFDLVRLHLYKGLDDGAESGTPVHKLPSFEAMRKLCSEYPAVLAELEERIHANARKDFPDADDALGRYERDYTEQGNAVRFADRFRDVLIHQKHLGWLFWDGMRWLRDAKSEATLLAMRFADTLLEEAKRLYQTAGDDKEAKAQAEAAYKWAKTSRGKQKIDNMLGLAKSLLDEPDLESFDADPWLLNTPNGIVDLRTGEMGPHDPEKRCTMLCAVAPETWDGDTALLWDSFLDRITGGDKDFAAYLQTMAGMSAVGAVYEEGMVISHGPGSNGKSTLINARAAVLGDYAGTIRPELLMARVNGQEAFGLEQVRGKRLVVAAETDEGAKLSASVMKRLTSRDPINANPKGKDPFTFNPTHTLVLHTNHLPRLRSLDEGTKRRIAIAPFDGVISATEVITDFGKRVFEQEGGMILGWIIEGARAFWKAERRLKQPEKVRRATDEYFNGEDWIAAFLDEKCETGKAFTERSCDLYAAYKAWTELNGEYTQSGKKFSLELEKRGFIKERVEKGMMWFGIRVSDV